MAQFEPISREHLGFVDILHVGRSDDDAFFYYVMELADDVVPRPSFEPTVYAPKTLRSELQRVARIPAAEVVALGLSLTTALAALHRHGLVHRDIKPANIIFCGGIPKIADIGLVSAMGQDSFVGTEGYVPPEGPGTTQADLYSLGKVLYEIAMGKDRLDFPALNTHIGELPDRDLLMQLNEVLLRACNFDPLQRYATAEEMNEDLLRVQEGRPLLRNPGRRRRRWLPIAALLAATAGGWAWYQKGGGPGTVQGVGSALVESEPETVRFRVDGLDGRLLQTNQASADLPAGHYVGHTLDPKFESIPFEFDVAPGAETKPPKLKLRRSVGMVSIATKTPDCEVMLRSGNDVIKMGKLTVGQPLEWKDVPTGSYEVVLRRDEAHQKRQPLVVERFDAKAPAPALLALDFAMRDFEITSVPEGAQIFADGHLEGAAPCKVRLIEGPHKLTARYRTWPEAARDVNDDTPAGVAFSFPLGSVKIITTPSGAEVAAGPRKLEDPTPTLDPDLEPGEITYTLTLPGQPTATIKAMVEPGKQVSAIYSFDSKPAPRRGEPWTNSLGMKFVPVGEVLVGVWPVRVSDWTTFCAEEGRPLVINDFQQEPTHPVVRVNRDDASTFCEWLTRHELAAGKLDAGQLYRLPTDVEWSAAAGLPPEGGNTPEQRDGLVRDLPWGKTWPPPPGSGNYADTSFKRGSLSSSRTKNIANYTDGFPQTSPVGSFPANKLGLYDMSGNVWQWVSDSYSGGVQRKELGVLRGGSWGTSKQEELRLGYRDVVDRTEQDVIFGFRCVLVPDR